MVLNHVQAQSQQHRSDCEGPSSRRWHGTVRRCSPAMCSGAPVVDGSSPPQCRAHIISPRAKIRGCRSIAVTSIQHKELCSGQSTYRADQVDAVACEILNRICVIDQNDYLKKRRQQELNAARVKLRQEAVAEHFRQRLRAGLSERDHGGEVAHRFCPH